MSYDINREAWDFIYTGFAAYEQGSYQRALEYFQKAADIMPNEAAELVTQGIKKIENGLEQRSVPICEEGKNLIRQGRKKLRP